MQAFGASIPGISGPRRTEAPGAKRRHVRAGKNASSAGGRSLFAARSEVSRNAKAEFVDRAYLEWEFLRIW